MADDDQGAPSADTSASDWITNVYTPWYNANVRDAMPVVLTQFSSMTGAPPAPPAAQPNSGSDGPPPTPPKIKQPGS